MDNDKKWRRFLQTLIPFLLGFSTINYVFSNWYVEQRLGCNYKLEYWDAGYSRIVHWDKVIIDEPITSCGHDRFWIIAKTIDKDYFIVKKSKLFSWDGSDQIIYGPMDSLSFYALKREEGIQSIELRTINRHDE